MNDGGDVLSSLDDDARLHRRPLDVYEIPENLRDSLSRFAPERSWAQKAPYVASVCALIFCTVAGIAGVPDDKSAGVANTETQSLEPPISPWRQERDLLKAVERAQAEHGAFSYQMVTPLNALASFYISGNRCESAVPVLLEALKVSRAAAGLFNPEQMQLLDPLLECYLSLDLQDDFEREQQYAMLLAEQTYGKNDLRILPALGRAALWYEEAGRYISAREVQARAVRLITKSSSKHDVRLVEPLRGIARAFRLEYVHGLHASDDTQYPTSPWRSEARLRDRDVRLDAQGASSLERALQILRTQANVDRAQLVETLLELADWQHMQNLWRPALVLYQQAWRESANDLYTGPPLFIKPVPIFYRTKTAPATLVRRLPYQQEEYNRYWVDFEFTVTRYGLVRNVKVTDSNAPKRWQADLARDFRRTRYRPQFESGQPIDVPGCRMRQGLFALR